MTIRMTLDFHHLFKNQIGPRLDSNGVYFVRDTGWE